MTNELYDVCLTGKVLTGHNQREVTVNLAQLVGVSIVQAETLLHEGSCVKAKADKDTATYYHEIIEETGAEAVIRSYLSEAPSMAKPAVSAALETPSAVAEQAVITASAEEVWLEPDQPFVEDFSPAPFAEIPPTVAVEDDQDITQPFRSPPPAPLRGRQRRTLVVVIAIGMVTVVAGAFLFKLATPQAQPGQALAKVGESLNLVQPYQQLLEQYWRRNGALPVHLQELGLNGVESLGKLAQLALIADGVLRLTYTEAVPGAEGQTLLLKPSKGEQGITWDCSGGTLSALERPLECRAPVVQ